MREAQPRRQDAAVWRSSNPAGSLEGVELDSPSQQSIFAITTSKKGEYKWANVRIDGRSISLLVDTAVKASIINLQTCSKIYGIQIPLQPSERKLLSYNGSSIKVAGELDAEFEFTASSFHS